MALCNKIFSHLLHCMKKDMHLTYTCKRTLFLSASLKGIHSKWRMPVLVEQLKRVQLLKEDGKYPIPRRSEFLDWNYEAELYGFCKRLNETIDDKLLRNALTEATYIRQEEIKLTEAGIEEPELNLCSNKELSEVGLALTKNFCTKYIRWALPLLPEEGVQAVVEYLSSVEILGKIGAGIGLKDLMLCTDYPPETETYARCMAAVIEALNLSSGTDKCEKFMLHFILTQLIGKDLWDMWQVEDPLDILKIILENSNRGPAEPRIIDQMGQNTIESVFKVGIYSDKKFIGSGYGETLATGLECAALDSLTRFFAVTIARNSLDFTEVPEDVHKKTNANTFIRDWSLQLKDDQGNV